MRAAINTIIDGLRNQPLALALVIVNVLYLVGGFVFLREERARTATVIAELLDRCDGKR
jgi:hypothetical protein